MAIEQTIKLKADTSEAEKGVKKVKQELTGVDKAAKGGKTGLMSMSGAAKGLGVAFKALGIGLIISAFMKLKDIFSGNIETARMFERVFSQLSAAFDVIRDRSEEFIKSLIKLKNPFKAFKEAFTGTTKEIREEVKAMGELTAKLQEVRDEERAMTIERANANKIIAESRLLAEDETLSMEERLVALKAAVAEEQRVAQLELDTQAKKVQALQEIIDLGKSSEEDMIELENERARLIDLQTASVLKQKRVVTEIVTFEKQIEAEKKKNADAETKRIEDEKKRKEKEAADLKKQKEKEKAEADKKAEELKKQTETELEILRIAGLSKEELEIDQATKKYEKLLALANKYGQDTTILTEQYNQQVQDIQDNYDQQEIAKQKALQDEKFAMRNQSVDQAQEIFNLIGSISQANIERDRIQLQKQLDLGLISQEQFDKQSQKLEKEAIKREKKNALLQILIDTAQGVAGAIKAGAGLIFPANLGAIASGVAAVLAGIASAKQVLNKVPGGGGGGDTDISSDVGGGGGSSSVAGIGGIAETLVPNINGETNQQPVQAFVVENEISDAQALQEELELQSTL